MRFGLDRRTVAALILLGGALLVARAPDALFRPQFWAEDGAVWYQDAHEVGPLRAVLKTQDGYFSTYLRLTAAAAQAVPLAHAPLMFAVVAFALQLLPAVFLFSSRFRRVIPDDRLRALLALLYLAAPNVGETIGNATNAQWHLAILACMVVLADVGAGRAWRAFDAAVLALSGISGPYAVFLLPLILIVRRKDRQPWRRVQLAVLASCAVIQVAALLLLNGGTRFGAFPTIDPAMLVRILLKQVFLGASLGAHGYAWVAALPLSGVLFALIAVAGSIVIVHAAAGGPKALRLFLLFAAINFAAALFAPNLGPGAHLQPDFAATAWQRLFISSTGSRYWLLPVLAFLFAAVWSVSPKNHRPVRLAGSVFLVLLGIGLVADFRRQPYDDLKFAERAEAFEAAPAGERVVFPLNPPGWQMVLVKK